MIPLKMSLEYCQAKGARRTLRASRGQVAKFAKRVVRPQANVRQIFMDRIRNEIERRRRTMNVVVTLLREDRNR